MLVNAFVDGRVADGTNAPPFGEVVRALAKAERLVSALRSGPMHKAALAETVGVSKSTVYNWTSELDDLGLVTRTGEGYRLTRIGWLHVEAFLEFEDASERIYGLESVLDELPVDLLPPRDLLRTGSLVTATGDPDAPMTELLALFESADRVSGLLPVLNSRLLSALSEGVREDRLALDLVVTPTARESPLDGGTDVAGLAAAHDGTRLSVAGESFSFGLFLAAADRTRVGVAAYTGHGHLAAFVALDSTEAVEWATTVTDRYRADAESVELPSDDGP